MSDPVRVVGLVCPTWSVWWGWCVRVVGGAGVSELICGSPPYMSLCTKRGDSHRYEDGVSDCSIQTECQSNINICKNILDKISIIQ